jgi:hypothetical protein
LIHKQKKFFIILKLYCIAKSLFVLALLCRARQALSKYMLDLVTTNLIREQQSSKAILDGKRGEKHLKFLFCSSWVDFLTFFKLIYSIS